MFVLYAQAQIQEIDALIGKIEQSSEFKSMDDGDMQLRTPDLPSRKASEMESTNGHQVSQSVSLKPSTDNNKSGIATDISAIRSESSASVDPTTPEETIETVEKSIQEADETNSDTDGNSEGGRVRVGTRASVGGEEGRSQMKKRKKKKKKTNQNDLLQKVTDTRDLLEIESSDRLGLPFYKVRSQCVCFL